MFMQCNPDEYSAIMKDFDEPGPLAPTGLHLVGANIWLFRESQEL